jgi:hypothetical protein
MTTAHLSAAPKPILQGIRDASQGNVPAVAEATPCSLPHLFIFASEGTTEPQLVVGNSAKQTFGDDIFSLRGPYTTHQTVMASVFNTAANSMILQRLEPDDAAPPSYLTLSLEIISSIIPVYKRTASGDYELDSDGNNIPDDSDAIAGHIARWVLNDVGESFSFGERNPRAGSMEGGSGGLTPVNPELIENLPGSEFPIINIGGDGSLQSTIYPIMDLEVSSFGVHGNLKGLRLWAPTKSSTSGADEATILDNSAFVYNMQMIQKADVNSQAKVVPTKSGSQSVAFTLKEASTNSAIGYDMDIEDILLDAYRNMEVQPRQFGSFNKLHVYRDNIIDVSTSIYNLEQPYQPDWIDLTPGNENELVNIVNLVGGENLDGNPYHSLMVRGVSSGGGIKLSPNTNHFAVGGSDGTMSNDVLNTLVKAELNDYRFKDMAYWPQSSLWDSGFSLDTTKAMFNVLGVRKDMYVVASTQDITLAQNTPEMDASAAIALGAAARAFPESELFGTQTCRAVILEQSGNLLNSQYKGLLPLTIELARMVAEFMGASNGVWKRDFGFDESPRNQITMFKSDSVLGTYKDPDIYAKNWDIGLIWAQTFDRKSLFFPQYQTVYNDSTSVLNSLINMAVTVEAEKVCDRAWRRLTGGSKLTAEQFIERSDDLIAELMSEGRFDDRFKIVPRTYFTDIDSELGYAWSTDIEIYMNNMMTVGTYTVIANRRADFAG